MKTVPIHSIHIDYTLVCPKCGWTHDMNQTQYNNSSYFIQCECGQTFKPNRPEKEKSIKEEQQYLDQIIAVAEIVESAGFNKKDARERVKKIFDKNKDVQTLVKEAVCL
jgi:transcription elongation factor Elf1